MIAITFDTLLFSHKLEEAGMPREQAEKLAEVQKEIVEAQNHALQETVSTHLATKKDIWEVKKEIQELDKQVDTKIIKLDNKIDLLRSEFKGKFNLLYWMLASILASCISIIFKLYF